MTIIILTGRKDQPKYDEPIYHGVFKNGDSACAWARDNLRNFEWHWQDISLQVNEDGTARID